MIDSGGTKGVILSTHREVAKNGSVTHNAYFKPTIFRKRESFRSSFHIANRLDLLIQAKLSSRPAA